MDLTWEQLRQLLNRIAEGTNKAVLDDTVCRAGEANWKLDLVVNAVRGNLLFVDAVGGEDEGDAG